MIYHIKHIACSSFTNLFNCFTHTQETFKNSTHIDIFLISKKGKKMNKHFDLSFALDSLVKRDIHDA